MAVGSTGGLLDLEDVPIKPFQHVLALVDLRWCPAQMLAGEREVSTRLVHLKWPFAVVWSRQCGLHEDVQAGPRRRDLGIAIEGCDYLPGPRFDFAGFSVAALVDVYAGEGVTLGEDEAHARHAVLFGVSDGGLERRPCFRVGAAGPPAMDRVRDLRNIAVAVLFAPTDELVGRSQLSRSLVY